MFFLFIIIITIYITVLFGVGVRLLLSLLTLVFHLYRSSLLEEDPSDTDNVHGSFNFFPELEYGLLPADNLLTDMILESDYDPSHLFGMARSKYLKTHAFSPSMDWGHGEGSALHVPSNLRQNDNTPLKVRIFHLFINLESSDLVFSTQVSNLDWTG